MPIIGITGIITIIIITINDFRSFSFLLSLSLIPMDHFRHAVNTKAVAWALLSQSLWLPLVGIDLHDRWQSESRRSRPLALPQAELAASLPPTLLPNPDDLAPHSPDGRFKTSASGVLLGASSPATHAQVGHILDGADEAVPVGQAAMTNRPFNFALQAPSPTPGGARSAATGPLASASGYDLLQRSFTPAELLGGPLSLKDLQAEPIPAVALSERARLARSSDPLAPLPQAWREPMRRALNAINIPSPLKPPAQLEAARVVHVPSIKVLRATAVPLALQSDGSVDLLAKPDDPAVLEAIRGWSGRQDLPASGRVAPAIVHVEPLKELPPLRSTAAIVQPAAHASGPILSPYPDSTSLPSPRPTVAPTANTSAPAATPAVPPVAELRGEPPEPQLPEASAAPGAGPQSLAPSPSPSPVPSAPVAPAPEVVPAAAPIVPQASSPAASAPQPAS